MAAMNSASISIERDGDEVIIALAGRWIIERANNLERALEAFTPGPATAVTVDLGSVKSLDTGGAWLVYRTVKRLAAKVIRWPLPIAGWNSPYCSIWSRPMTIRWSAAYP